MKHILSLVSVWFLAFLGKEVAGSSFSYKGVSTWKNHYKFCGGKKQSPIDINPQNTALKTIDIDVDYDDQEDVTYSLANNGHSAQITLGGKMQCLTLKVEGKTYQPLQIHFHWGSKDDRGSEHTIFGKPYSAEMHIVHMNKKYDNIAKALKNPDGLLVLGTFIEIGEENDELEGIFNNLEKIKVKGQKTEIKDFNLEDILPRKKGIFFHYEGSLTTPGCNEVVKWILFKRPIQISKEQMAKFRSLKGDESKQIVDNFRPTQPLNGRIIYVSSDSFDFIL